MADEEIVKELNISIDELIKLNKEKLLSHKTTVSAIEGNAAHSQSIPKR